VTKSIFAAKHFNDEAAAYAYVEARLWANGRPCPHCGVFDRSGALKAKGDRIGLYKCYACRKPFTVKIGTIFEKSHIQMRDWLYAIHVICSSKKGVSANQLHRTLGITLKSAWFMGHRIREAFRSGSLAPMGGVGRTVEADETFIGRKDGTIKRRGHGHKNAVLSLVDRNSGQVRSFYVEGTSAAEKHLHRYVAEFDFRYNNRIAFGVGDKERAVHALEGATGKRLIYRDSLEVRA
jgi:transposase-like protein